MAFSRGLYSGWLHGVNHQELVHARYGKKRGALIGTVAAVGRHYLEVKAGATPVRPGDGVVIDQGGDTENEQGGRVYDVAPQGGAKGVLRLGFERGRIHFGAVRVGDRLWKTDDPQLNRELRRSWSGEIPAPKRCLDFTVSGRAGAPLRLEARSGDAHALVESAMPLEIAQKRPLTTETLRAQLGRLGETAFELGALDNRLEGDVIVPVSELNRLRREVVQSVAAVYDRRAEPEADSIGGHRPPLQMIDVVRERLDALAYGRAILSKVEAPRLIVLCRDLVQIDVALRLGLTDIYADFEDIRRYKDAVELVRRHGGEAEILLATPRIQKAGEQGFFKLIENARPDGVLIRNLGAMDYFRASRDETSLRRVGDFSLNVANPLTAELLMAEKLERLTVSYDLNAGQVLDLLRAAPPAWFEITLHQHIPMFHMEHCVFAAFLSSGTDYTNCGRPCDTHRVELRDRVGLRHPLKADVGCRNTLFHAQAQSGAAFFDAFRREGRPRSASSCCWRTRRSRNASCAATSGCWRASSPARR
ncbi:MAG: DUF3656 domain-containing protein [Verrucomicrobiota bacterium]